MKKLVILSAAIALTIAGCGTTEGNDAGIEKRAHGDRPVYDMPDGYPNVSAVCVKGLLVLVTSGSNTAPVVVQSPTCAGLGGVPPRAVAS